MCTIYLKMWLNVIRPCVFIRCTYFHMIFHHVLHTVRSLSLVRHRRHTRSTAMLSFASMFAFLLGVSSSLILFRMKCAQFSDLCSVHFELLLLCTSHIASNNDRLVEYTRAHLKYNAIQKKKKPEPERIQSNFQFVTVVFTLIPSALRSPFALSLSQPSFSATQSMAIPSIEPNDALTSIWKYNVHSCSHRIGANLFVSTCHR